MGFAAFLGLLDEETSLGWSGGKKHPLELEELGMKYLALRDGHPHGRGLHPALP